MQIQDIFKKDIARNINGVVKAEQKDDESIYVELDEYVVTRELRGHFYTFFENYLKVVTQQGGASNNIGVWISGFFGSGKSHFLKILSYLLENREVSSAAHPETRTALSFFEDKISDPMMLANLKRAAEQDTEVILFNIDSHARTDDKEDAILNVFFKMFNEHIGYCGEFPHIAAFERELSKRGGYQHFKEAFKRINGNNWEDERDAYGFLQDDIIQALCEALAISEEGALYLFNNIENSVALSINNFCDWVKEYLDAHPGKNIAFLVDEVGQFIGSNTQLMLKLQTLVEDLGVKCDGRAWVIVTSQADIDATLGHINKSSGNDFSKIQGRFPTRISLSSSNTEEVIQKRLLEKREEAETKLTEIYHEKGDILRNQLSFDQQTTVEFKNYSDADTFVKNYPFVPYHYALVQSVFESIREKGATGKHLAMGERSLLDAFQAATRQVQDEGLDVLIPFYRFYMPIESFLEPVIKRTFEQAKDNSVLQEQDRKLLKTLFLIRYVEKLKSTLDNIVTLSIERIDQDIIALREEVKASLERLEGQMYIARTGDEFIFLTNEEKEIENEIRKQDVAPSQVTAALSVMLFDDIFKGNNKLRYNNGQDFPVSRFCNGHPRDGQELQDLVLRIITPLDSQYAEFNERDYLTLSAEKGQGVLICMQDDDPRLWQDLEHYVRTELFVSNSASITDENRRLYADKKQENRERRNRLIRELTESLQKADIYSAGDRVENDFPSVEALFKSALSHYLENTFSKLRVLKHLTKEPDLELKSLLSGSDVEQFTLDGVDASHLNVEALKEVEARIKMATSFNERVTLDSIVETFTRSPYGWPDKEVLILVARLAVLKKISFEFEGNSLKHKDAYEKLTSTRYRRQVRVHEIKQSSDSELKKVVAVAEAIFNKPLGGLKEHELRVELENGFKGIKERLQEYSNLQKQNVRLPGESVLNEGRSLVHQLLKEESDYDFNQTFLKLADQLREFMERFQYVDNFYSSQLPIWQSMERALTQTYNHNRRYLEDEPQSKEALEGLEAIYNNPEPYRELRNVNNYLAAIEKVNQKLVEERRENALARIGGRIALIQAELENVSASDDLRNQALRDLQQHKEIVENSQSLDAIFKLQEESQGLEFEANELIKAYIAELAKRNAAKRESDRESGVAIADGGEDFNAAPIIEGDDQPEAPTARPFVRPLEILKAREVLLNAQDAQIIETEEELEELLSAVEKRLSGLLKMGKRIRLN